MTRLVPVIPDGGWGWVVVVGSFLIHVFADGFVYSFGVLVEELVNEFHATNFHASIILSLLTGLTLGFGPVASAVTNKYGCRTSTIIGSVIATIGCASSYYATDMPYLFISVGVVMGVGVGLMYCPAIVIVTMYFEKRRALATGLAVSGAGIGTWIFPVFYGYVRSAYSWREVFIVGAVFMALCGVCGTTFRPLQFIEKEDDDEESEGTPTKSEESKDAKEDAALLSPPHKLKASSHTDVNSTTANGIKAARSSGDVEKSDEECGAGDAHVPRSRAGTVTEGTGYLSVKGVLYTGSITNVNEFQKNPDKFRSMTSLHSRSRGKLNELKEEGDDDVFEDEKSSGCTLAACGRGFSNMLNLGLLTEGTFLLFAVSNLLTSVGFNSPLYFLPLHASSGLKLAKEQGDMTLSVFGICNTIGRITFGLVGDRVLPLPRGLGKDTARNRLWIYNISLSICGLLTCLSFMFDDFVKLCIYSGIFGFSISSYICLTSVILVDLLGLEKLTNAFGLLLLFQGVGTVFGPPVSGYLADSFNNNYNYSFFFCGVNLLISGLMMFGAPLLKKSDTAPVSNGAKRNLPIH